MTPLQRFSGTKTNKQINVISKTNTKAIGELKKSMDSIDIYISNKKCQVKEIIQRTEQKCTDGKDGGETSMGPEI